MKSAIMAIVLASAMLFAEKSLADTWYHTIGETALTSEPMGKGWTRCVIPHGSLVKRVSENWSEAIFVEWKDPTPGFIDRMQWFGGTGTKGYCPAWNTKGWVRKSGLKPYSE